MDNKKEVLQAIEKLQSELYYSCSSFDKSITNYRAKTIISQLDYIKSLITGENNTKIQYTIKFGSIKKWLETINYLGNNGYKTKSTNTKANICIMENKYKIYTIVYTGVSKIKKYPFYI